MGVFICPYSKLNLGDTKATMDISTLEIKLSALDDNIWE
jgi:hypothetical protein